MINIDFAESLIQNTSSTDDPARDRMIAQGIDPSRATPEQIRAAGGMAPSQVPQRGQRIVNEQFDPVSQEEAMGQVRIGDEQWDTVTQRQAQDGGQYGPGMGVQNLDQLKQVLEMAGIDPQFATKEQIASVFGNIGSPEAPPSAPDQGPQSGQPPVDQTGQMPGKGLLNQIPNVGGSLPSRR